MGDIVLRHVPSGPCLRVLDLGCGTGDLVFRLAARMPSASLVGIDISTLNIAIAMGTRTKASSADRIEFAAVDWLDFEAPAFDLIVSDSVIHLIEGPTDVVFSKVAHHLRPGGVLINNMPYSCAYNRALWTLRRCLGVIRGRQIEAFVLAVARVLHGRQFSRSQLQERISYMYLVPRRVTNASLEKLLASCGLERIAEYATPHPSLGQPKHKTTVLRRTK